MKVKKDVVLEEIKKELDWKGKIVLYLYPKMFIKRYKKGIEKGFNSRI